MLTFYQRASLKGQLQQVDEPSDTRSMFILSQSLTKRDAQVLEESYDLAGHLLSDVFDIHELPRVERHDDKSYIYVRSAVLSDKKLVSFPVLFVVGEAFFARLATRQYADNADRHLLQDGVTPLRAMLNGLHDIATTYEELVDAISTHIEKIEQRMRSHEVTNDDFYDFVTIESNLNRAHMNLMGLRNVTNQFAGIAMKRPNREMLDDVRLYAEQLLVQIESSLQAIGSIRSAYSTISNNTLNQRMKLLTALTLIMALPNVFYGMYGMNIKLPFMHEEWAYFAIVGFTIALMALIFVVARMRRFF